jgi:hypothetical protein
MSTICLSSRSARSWISFGRDWNFVMSILSVDRRAPDESKRATCDQGRKIRRRSVATTSPVTGG